MELLNYWSDEKPKKKVTVVKAVKKEAQPKPEFAFSGKKLALGGVVVIAFFYLSQSLWQKPKLFQESRNLPEVDVGSAGMTLGETSEEEKEPSIKLKLLSINLIGIHEESQTEAPTPTPTVMPPPEEFEPSLEEGVEEEVEESFESSPSAEATSSSDLQPPPPSDQKLQLVGVRILGEYQNIGNMVAHDVRPIIRFYDKTGRLLATKRAEPTSPFRFLPLEPNEISLYDVSVPSPPDSQRFQIELKPVPPSKETVSSALSPKYLKLKEKNLEDAVANTEAGTVNYHKFNGTMVNTSQNTLTNILVYTWLKNKDGKVFADGVKEFSHDLLATNQELEVLMSILPAQLSEMESYEVKLWAEPI